MHAYTHTHTHTCNRASSCDTAWLFSTSSLFRYEKISDCSTLFCASWIVIWQVCVSTFLFAPVYGYFVLCKVLSCAYVCACAGLCSYEIVCMQNLVVFCWLLNRKRDSVHMFLRKCLYVWFGVMFLCEIANIAGYHICMYYFTIFLYVIF